MRNIDYRALYQQVVENEVDPKKRRGTYDKKTQDERTKKACDDNLARRASDKLAKKGIGTGKKCASPVEPANLMKVEEEDFQEKCQRLIDEGFCSNIEDVYRLYDLIG